VSGDSRSDLEEIERGSARGRAFGVVADGVLARRSGEALLFGAGLVTIANSALSRLRGVDVFALRLTGLVTMLSAIGVSWLPWDRRARLVSVGVSASAIAALVVTDRWHHYSHNDAALAVYPMFFVLVIAFTGLTQPRGMATLVAVISGGALAWLLYDGGHGSAAVQSVVVTVPAAAMLGEVISWAYGHARRLATLDTRRRMALEALVFGASQLQDALTPSEIDAVVIDTAVAVFAGRDPSLHHHDTSASSDRPNDGVSYDTESHQLQIPLRGQVGTLAELDITIDAPDAFAMDTARLFGQQIGGRLEQLRVINALSDAASHDALTGVHNRRGAETQLDRLRPGDAVMILDLDHFKAINDSLGHQTGDQVLTEFGDFLRAKSRSTDLVARYGGEEFLLICRNVTADLAANIIDRLLDNWRARRPLVTFSAGYAVHRDGDEPALTVAHADSALYQAKHAGRDQARAHAAWTNTGAQPPT
jgi:diguanylate cyclase (GGDEF)-like protein